MPFNLWCVEPVSLTSRFKVIRLKAQGNNNNKSRQQAATALTRSGHTAHRGGDPDFGTGMHGNGSTRTPHWQVDACTAWCSVQRKPARCGVIVDSKDVVGRRRRHRAGVHRHRPQGQSSPLWPQTQCGRRHGRWILPRSRTLDARERPIAYTLGLAPRVRPILFFNHMSRQMYKLFMQHAVCL